MLTLIKNDSDYDKAFNRLNKLMHVQRKREPKEFHEMVTLSLMVEKYETENFPIRQSPFGHGRK